MDKKISELSKAVNEVSGNYDIKKLFDEVDHLLKTDPRHLDLLRLRAELNIKLQIFGSAINDFNAVLAITPDDQAAKARIDQLQSILKYNNTDIYANPNTHFDPWLD